MRLLYILIILNFKTTHLQLYWTYYSLSGFPYRIDMYHGEDSGHLIIFVNSRIINIDFNKNDGHLYSFFIENQLLTLEIEEENKSYNYTLTPQKVENPNLIEERTFNKHFWVPLIVIILVINLIFLFL